MSIPALTTDGILPPGRYECTQQELRETFVDGADYTGSISRLAIWQNWETAVLLLSSSVLVHSAWISGSFVTTKKNPRDIDVTFVINEEDRGRRGPADLKVIESFIRRIRDPHGGKAPIAAHGLLVDSYVVDWSPHNPDAQNNLTPAYINYAQERGYWDDWWSRKRISAKGSAPSREDAIPRRGYLEVTLNAYL